VGSWAGEEPLNLPHPKINKNQTRRKEREIKTELKIETM